MPRPAAPAGTAPPARPDGRLPVHFTVTDDGDGFDPDDTAMGSGRVNMTDRVDALGGTVVLRSEPGRGTTLAGSIPAPVAAAPEREPVPAG